MCVLTAANFSYMSIFLHIRSHIHTHTHTHTGKNSLKFCLARARKCFWHTPLLTCGPPGRDSAIFGFSTSTMSVATKDLACWPRHTHTHTRIHVSCLCCAKRCRGSIHQLTLDFISFCRRCLLEMRFPFWVYCHCLTLAFAFGLLFSLFLCLLCTLFLFLRTS